MQTNQQSQESRVQEIIELKIEWANHYEKLANSIKDSNGQVIMAEIINFINILNKELFETSMQVLPEPYEYPREDLNKLRSLRAKIASLTELQDRLDYESAMAKAIAFRQEAEALRGGESIEPIY